MAALPVIGGIASAIGANDSANARSRADQFNAKNAQINADQAIQQSDEQARMQEVYSTQSIGNEKASYGASGVDAGSGSAMDVLAQSAKNAELDKLKIQHSGAMKAWAYKSGAQLDGMDSDAAQSSVKYSAASAILGGGAGAYSMMRGSGGSGGGDD